MNSHRGVNGRRDKPPITQRRWFALVILGVALLVGLVVLQFEGPIKAANPPTTSRAAQPAVQQPTEPTVAPSHTYPELHPLQNSRGFIRDVHANNIDPPGYDDALLLTVGQSTCEAWEHGVTYAQTVQVMNANLTTWSQHDKDALVIIAATNLCPQFDGKYGA